MSINLINNIDGPWDDMRGFVRQNFIALQLAINNLLAGQQVGRATAAKVITLTDATNITLDASLGSVFRIEANGNRKLAVPANPTAGQIIVIQHYAIGANRTLSLATGTPGFRFNTTFASLSATVANTTDYIWALYNDTDAFWDIQNVVKG